MGLVAETKNDEKALTGVYGTFKALEVGSGPTSCPVAEGPMEGLRTWA